MNVCLAKQEINPWLLSCCFYPGLISSMGWSLPATGKAPHQAIIGHGQASPSAAASASLFSSAPASFGRLVPMEPVSRT